MHVCMYFSLCMCTYVHGCVVVARQEPPVSCLGRPSISFGIETLIGLELTNQARLTVQCSRQDPLSVPPVMGLQMPPSMSGVFTWVLGVELSLCACKVSTLLTEPSLPRPRQFEVHRQMGIDAAITLGYWFWILVYMRVLEPVPQV